MEKRLRNLVDEPSIVTKLCFYAFLCTLPFETLPFPLLGSQFSIAKLSGIFLFLASVLDSRACFRRAPREFWLLLIYVSCGVLVVALADDSKNVSFVALSRNPQLLILFLIAFNLFSIESIRKEAVIVLTSGISTFSWMHTLKLLDIRSMTEYVDGVGQVERTAGLSSDPNFATSLAGIGILGCFVILISFNLLNKYARMAFIVFCIGCLLSVAQMSSRGGVLSITVGLFALGVVYWRKEKSWTPLFCLAALVVAAGFAVWQSDLFRSRIEKTISSGDTAGRLEIWEATLRVWSSHPIVGCGFEKYLYAVGTLIGEPQRNTHNTILSVLVSTGIVGVVPVLVVMFRIISKLTKSTNNWDGMLSASWIALDIMASLSLNLEHQKWFWITLAFALASDHSTEDRTSWKNDKLRNARKHRATNKVLSHAPAMRFCVN